MEMACADCGCVVERGVVIKPCGEYPDCCCRELSRDAGSGNASET